MDKRPVYILGAGFSKAIDNSMPTTDELGRRISERLKEQGRESSYHEKDSFEDWLSIQVQDLPFLDYGENLKRRSEAYDLIQAIGSVLDEIVEKVSLDKPWLEKLIRVWHAEKAIIITFNYDTLLERAINQYGLHVSMYPEHGDFGFEPISGDSVVFPSPRKLVVHSSKDEILASDRSMQIIKLHGSLNWYWPGDDTPGAEVRLPMVETSEDRMLSAYTLGLKRLLIPPASNKNNYYSHLFSQTLWMNAYKKIKEADRICFMGYSLPKTDFAVNEMLKMSPVNVPITIVDKKVNNFDGPRRRIFSACNQQAVSTQAFLSDIEKYAEIAFETQTQKTISQLRAAKEKWSGNTPILAGFLGKDPQRSNLEYYTIQSQLTLRFGESVSCSQMASGEIDCKTTIRIADLNAIFENNEKIQIQYSNDVYYPIELSHCKVNGHQYLILKFAK